MIFLHAAIAYKHTHGGLTAYGNRMCWRHGLPCSQLEVGSCFQVTIPRHVNFFPRH